MCGVCGCSETHNEHRHEHNHDHDHEYGQQKLVTIEQDIMAENNQYAAYNRGYLNARRIRSFNLVSSPGAGKTCLLVKTIEALQSKHTVSVIEGDQETERDADKIRPTKAATVQINTGKTCHLDAHRVGHALEQLDPPTDSVLFVENVGNLVCPAMFDLGENHRVVLVSVTEGDDKPIKYPSMFEKASLLVITKNDLCPYVDFDSERCRQYAYEVNPYLTIVETSTYQPNGLQPWLQWLENQLDPHYNATAS